MTKEMKIGMIALTAAILLGIFSLFALPLKIFHQDIFEVHAVFDNARGIKKSAQVLYAGVIVGRVNKIRTENGKAVLDLYIRNKEMIPTDCRVSIDSSALVGDLYVKLSGGRPGGDILKDGDTIYEYHNDRMDKLMEKAGKLMESAQKVQENIEALSGDKG